MTETLIALAAALGVPPAVLALVVVLLAFALLALAVWLFGKERVAAWIGPRLSARFPAPRPPPL